MAKVSGRSLNATFEDTACLICPPHLFNFNAHPVRLLLDHPVPSFSAHPPSLSCPSRCIHKGSILVCEPTASCATFPPLTTSNNSARFRVRQPRKSHHIPIPTPPIPSIWCWTSSRTAQTSWTRSRREHPCQRWTSSRVVTAFIPRT